MNDIYWITRMDYLHYSGIVFLGFALFSLLSMIYSESEKCKYFIITSIILSIIGILILIFVPTTDEMCFIYFGGKTQEFLKDNNIPEELMKIAKKYMELKK